MKAIVTVADKLMSDKEYSEGSLEECEQFAEDRKQPYDEVDAVLFALEWARKNALAYEFMEFFLIDYKKTGDVASAIAFANREWDL